MKRLKLFVPLIVFCVMAAFLALGLRNDPSYLPSAMIGKPLPQFTLMVLETDQQVVTTDLVDLMGEPFLLNVWATWCPTCAAEHKYLQTLADRGVKIIGLNYKDENDKARQWLARLGNPYEFNIVDPDGRMGLNLGVYGAPETFIIDRKGVIRFRHAGDMNERVWQGEMASIFKGL